MMDKRVNLHYLCTNLEGLCNVHFIDFTAKIIRITSTKILTLQRPLDRHVQALIKKLYFLITHHIYPVAAFARRAASEN